MVGTNGPQRVKLEMALTEAGHVVYFAGSIAETMLMAGIYVPQAVLMLAPVADGSAADLAAKLQASEKAMLRDMPVVSPLKAKGVLTAAGNRPAQMMAALPSTL